MIGAGRWRRRHRPPTPSPSILSARPGRANGPIRNADAILGPGAAAQDGGDIAVGLVAIVEGEAFGLSARPDAAPPRFDDIGAEKVGRDRDRIAAADVARDRKSTRLNSSH